jgi:hypothetical protein
MHSSLLLPDDNLFATKLFYLFIEWHTAIEGALSVLI